MVIPTPGCVIDRVNEMGISEKHPEGIQFSNIDGRATINDLDLNMNDDNDNSNASDESFDHDKEYQKEFVNDKKKGDEDLNTDKTQEDYFNLPFQQHHALLTDQPKTRCVRESRKRTLKHKQQKLVRYKTDDDTSDSGVGEEGDDYNKDDNSTSNSGVRVPVSYDTSNSEVNDKSTLGEEGVNVPFYGLDSDFGDAPYWNNGTIITNSESYILSVIATFSNVDGLHRLRSTPQYRFSRGMKEFGKAGYDATVSELSDI